MSELKLVHGGYVCVPYSHDRSSADLKDSWIESSNIESMYFATSTFSSESKPYFTNSSNHYILAKFKDQEEIINDSSNYQQEKITFIFNIDEEIFERETEGLMNFVSFYFMGYGEDEDDIRDIATVVSKRYKVGKAGLGNLKIVCTKPPKFNFPYANQIIALEVSSEKSHQSVNKYCEKTRSEVNRKGLSMYNLMSLSLLEKIK